MKKIIAGIAVIILIIVGVFYYSKNSKQTANKESIKIGGAFALTGFASTWGEADRNGAMLAVEEINKNGGINGKPVEILIEDTMSDNLKTLSAVRKLIDIHRLNVIIGPTWMDSYGSPAPVAQHENIIIITPSGAITAIKSKENYKNVFSTWYRSDIQLQKLPKYFSETQNKKIALIISNDSFWDDAVSNFKSKTKENDIDIVAEYKINPSEKDLRTQIIKLKQINPDIVFFGFSSEQNLVAFLNQKKNLYPAAKLFTTESIEEFTKNKDIRDLLDGINYISPKILENGFYSKYKEKYGIEPIYSASNSYDAVNIILEAIKNENIDTNSIGKYLLNNKFKTITFGNVDFDDIGGVVGGNFVVKKIEKESINIIKDSL